MSKYQIKVEESLVGKRTDKLLAEQLPQFPRAALQKLFDKELVWLNDKVTKPGIKVRLGDKLKADLSPLDIKIDDIDLPIIYQDDDVLVIDKPAGVISHARGKYFDEPSVASFLRQITLPQHITGPGLVNERAGIVHRLDRATSGVMICAKNQETLSFLQKQFSARKVKKTYSAIIEGKMPSEEGLIDMPIGRNMKIPKLFQVSELGKAAQTRYETVKSNDEYSLLSLTPLTGRTHQIRVHLKELHRPIVGDELYSGKVAPRLLLHASSLEITLPNKERAIFASPLPNEFGDYIS
jgi:23S rRNA pseudouridine1911/1915/1917 synthase